MAGKQGGKGGRRKPTRKQNRHGNSEGNRSSRRQEAPSQTSGSQTDGQVSSSANVVPLAETSDPPGNYDTDPDSRTGDEDFSDADHDRKKSWNHVQREKVDEEHELSPNYSYSSEESDQNYTRQDKKHDPKDWEEEEVEQYHQLQTQIIQQDQEQQHEQYNHDDHGFTQFNIQPLQQSQHDNNEVQEEEGNDEDYSDSEGEEDEDEEAPLFFTPSNNFNSATDTYSEQHIKGEDWGVDYLLSRANRKERERKQQFEIDQQRQSQKQSQWWWGKNEDDDWDDVDFDNYHNSSFKCRRGVKYIVVFALTFTAVIAFLARGKLGSRSTQHADSEESEQLASHHGSVPSSRWGHRFDDDDAAIDNDGDDTIEIVDSRNDVGVPKYHKHSHSNHHSQLTPEEKALDQENWEDYEMEVANVLADASPGWDIHSKTGGNDTDNDSNDGFTDHWVQYYDKSSQWYYYFHRETNTTQWEKPEVDEGVVLLGITYGTGSEYIIEKGDTIESEQLVDEENDVATVNDTSVSIEADSPPIFTELSDFDSQEVLDRYKDSYWRWNHPYRIPERTDAWGGIDVPVFWRVPLSGATTVEEIFTHCYNMIVAGTTGASKDGKSVLNRNISEHLSVLTFDDGAHYLNIDMNTLEGVQAARKAGLGRSGVADVIITRYMYNAADLFKDTGHTGRCFTILRHPIDRAVALFHSLKRNGAKAVSGMTINQYANSSLAEENWMTRMITNTMEKKLTERHLQVAKEVIGRKCLVGFIDKNFEETMDRFTKFFRWENLKSVNKHHVVGSASSEENDLEGKRKCASKLVKTGVNRHQYAKVPETSEVWRLLRAKNTYDIELYKYAEAIYYKQNVVFDINE
mmetsp:Transcript_25381/g.54582  ORF Transcript_25381/g.54582 Transcript_25381/m.54582 type:complete len:856 (+) Transcript_25381:53-2620(+)